MGDNVHFYVRNAKIRKTQSSAMHDVLNATGGRPIPRKVALYL